MNLPDVLFCSLKMEQYKEKINCKESLSHLQYAQHSELALEIWKGERGRAENEPACDRGWKQNHSLQVSSALFQQQLQHPVPMILYCDQSSLLVTVNCELPCFSHLLIISTRLIPKTHLPYSSPCPLKSFSSSLNYPSDSPQITNYLCFIVICISYLLY